MLELVVALSAYCRPMPFVMCVSCHWSVSSPVAGCTRRPTAFMHQHKDGAAARGLHTVKFMYEGIAVPQLGECCRQRSCTGSAFQCFLSNVGSVRDQMILNMQIG